MKFKYDIDAFNVMQEPLLSDIAVVIITIVSSLL